MRDCPPDSLLDLTNELASAGPSRARTTPAVPPEPPPVLSSYGTSVENRCKFGSKQSKK